MQLGIIVTKIIIMDPNFGAQVVLEKVFRGHQKSNPLV